MPIYYAGSGTSLQADGYPFAGARVPGYGGKGADSQEEGNPATGEGVSGLDRGKTGGEGVYFRFWQRAQQVGYAQHPRQLAYRYPSAGSPGPSGTGHPVNGYPK